MVPLFWWIVASPMHLATHLSEPAYAPTRSMPQFVSPSSFASSARLPATITNCMPIHLNALNVTLVFGRCCVCYLHSFSESAVHHSSIFVSISTSIGIIDGRLPVDSFICHHLPSSFCMLTIVFLISFADISIVFLCPPCIRLHLLQLSI